MFISFFSAYQNASISYQRAWRTYTSSGLSFLHIRNLQKIPTMWRKKRPSMEGVIYITRAYVLAVFHQLDTVEAEQIMFL